MYLVHVFNVFKLFTQEPVAQASAHQSYSRQTDLWYTDLLPTLPKDMVTSAPFTQSTEYTFVLHSPPKMEKNNDEDKP